MEIQSITIGENQDGADVEILLGDAPEPDDAREYLAFSLSIEYDRSQDVSLEKIKELALAKARKICSEQASAAKKKLDDY
ncbi:MAG: hypothetical protein WDZ52_00860 [Pseudohongiellaceae bacterium]